MYSVNINLRGDVVKFPDTLVAPDDIIYFVKRDDVIVTRDHYLVSDCTGT